MGKTYKTAPFWVKAAKNSDLLIPWHSCQGVDVACDLPAKRGIAHSGMRGTSCQWIPGRELLNLPLARCGCPMCSMQAERRAERRLDRHAARRYSASDWRAEYGIEN